MEGEGGGLHFRRRKSRGDSGVREASGTRGVCRVAVQSLLRPEVGDEGDKGCVDQVDRPSNCLKNIYE
jgi:hypothetical protein